MKFVFPIFYILLLGVFVISCTNTLRVTTVLDLNVSREISLTETIEEWCVHSESFGYKIVLDTQSSPVSRASFLIENDSNSVYKTFGGTAFQIENKFQGDSITISGWLKLENVDGFAGIWIRTDFSSTNQACFENMIDYGLKGTKTWDKYEITIPLNPNVSTIEFGALLVGEGKVWSDYFELFIDDKRLQPQSNYKAQKFDKSILENISEAAIVPKNDNFTFEDFDFLFGDLSKTNVVMLGETTHGTSESQMYRLQIIDYLVKNHGFKTIVLEESVSSPHKLNRKINEKGNIDSVNIASCFDFFMHASNEFKKLVLYSKNNSVKLEGIDIQSPLLVIKELENLLPEKTTSIELTLLKDSISQYQYNEFPITAIRGIKDACKNLTLRKNFFQEENKVEFFVQAILDYCELVQRPFGHYGIVRDSIMAENIHRLIKKHENSKLIVLAHNGHVERNYKSLGSFVSKFSNTKVVGFSTGKGLYSAYNYSLNSFSQQNRLNEVNKNSYEDLFTQLSFKVFGLNLNASSLSPESKSWLSYPRFFRLIGAKAEQKQFSWLSPGLRNAYDYIIHIDSTTATSFK